MKKTIVALLLVGIMAALFTPLAYAGVIGVLDYSVSSTIVNLNPGGVGSFSITTPGGNEYAAVQYALILPDGADILVSYSSLKVTSPLFPQNDSLGTTYFSTGIASSNIFTESLTCTVYIIYTGPAVTTLTIMEIKQYILNSPTIDSYVSNKTTTVTLVPYSSAISADATLSSLEIDPGVLTPVFDPNTTIYTSSVDSSVSSVTVTAIANNINATVEGAGIIPLTAGENTITVTVTAEDKLTKKVYVITIFVEAIDIPITTFHIDAAAAMTVMRGASYKFEAILNDGISASDIVWKVSNTSYATVNAETGVVTIKNITGTVLLTATAPGGVSSSIVLRII